MNRAAVEAQLAELPLAEYVWFETAELEFSERIRTVCRENCPRRVQRSTGFPRNRAPSARTVPGRTAPAATRTGCFPA